MKICTGCNEAKPLTDFFRDLRKANAYMSRCKVCKRDIILGHAHDSADRLVAAANYLSRKSRNGSAGTS